MSDFFGVNRDRIVKVPVYGPWWKRVLRFFTRRPVPTIDWIPELSSFDGLGSWIPEHPPEKETFFHAPQETSPSGLSEAQRPGGVQEVRS